MEIIFGTKQVEIITSSAERQAATEFAKARSVRPQMIGQALREIGQDPDVLNAVYETLEVERLEFEPPAASHSINAAT